MSSCDFLWIEHQNFWIKSFDSKTLEFAVFLRWILQHDSRASRGMGTKFVLRMHFEYIQMDPNGFVSTNCFERLRSVLNRFKLFRTAWKHSDLFQTALNLSSISPNYSEPLRIIPNCSELLRESPPIVGHLAGDKASTDFHWLNLIAMKIRLFTIFKLGQAPLTVRPYSGRLLVTALHVSRYDSWLRACDCAGVASLIRLVRRASSPD